MSALERQTIISFVQFMAFAGLLLFVPAWTLAYWQAWLFLTVFMAASILITTYVWRKDRALLERRLNAGPAAEKEPIQRLIQTFASISIITLFVFPAIDHRFGWSHVPVPAVIAADIVIAIGFYIVFRVFKENSFSAATIEIAPGQRAAIANRSRAARSSSSQGWRCPTRILTSCIRQSAQRAWAGK